jgi:hypothetical protein
MNCAMDIGTGEQLEWDDPVRICTLIFRKKPQEKTQIDNRNCLGNQGPASIETSEKSRLEVDRVCRPTKGGNGPNTHGKQIDTVKEGSSLGGKIQECGISNLQKFQVRGKV